MPSKALFEPIDTIHRARRWTGAGPPADPDAFLDRIVRWKDAEIARFRAFRHNAIARHAADGLEVVPHPARFVDSHTLEANGRRYEVDSIVLATGSDVIRPPIEGLGDVLEGLWTSEEILDNRRLPESLIVIGAGAIGLEFSLRYARLGCRVTVVSKGPVLPGFPREFGERMAEIYEREGVRMLPSRVVAGIRRDADGWFVCTVEGEAGVEPLVAERVLLAAGRRPNLDSLDLDAAGIATGERGAIEIGPDLRIAGCDHIFAAGDVGGRRMVVHHAHIEAGIAVENALDDGAREWSKKANLKVVFSDPEFAFAGVSAEEAQRGGTETAVARKESRLVGKLHLAGDDHGFGVLVADARAHTVVGAGLLCDDAANLIHLPAYLIEHGHTVHEASSGEYYHPTKIEIVTAMIDALCADLGGTPYDRAPE